MLSETIVDILKNEYKSGKKQAEIAKKYNLDQQTVSRLISGKRNAAGLTLETVAVAKEVPAKVVRPAVLTFPGNHFIGMEFFPARPAGSKPALFQTIRAFLTLTI